jgi:hypothetical protein
MSELTSSQQKTMVCQNATVKRHSFVKLPHRMSVCWKMWEYMVAWWLSPTPLKNDGVRQWEGWHPIYEMENNPVIFETTNQIYVSQMSEFIHVQTFGEKVRWRMQKWHGQIACQYTMWTSMPQCMSENKISEYVRDRMSVVGDHSNTVIYRPEFGVRFEGPVWVLFIATIHKKDVSEF